MRVTIEVVSGNATGRRIVLRAGQTVQFGRTDWADYSFPQDGRMSSVHFALTADQGGCSVEDLKSSNGTFVNERRIAAKTPLADGDALRAGQTTFAVRFEEADAPVSRASVASAVAPPVMPVARPSIPPGPAKPFAPPPEQPRISYSVEKCESGLTLCRGQTEEIPPSELAVLLSQTFPPYLIVDFKHLGTPPPAELTSPNYLFDWLDPSVAPLVSPVVIGREDLVTWPALIEDGWGKDAVVCLFSGQEKESLLDQLRRACRARSPQDPRGGVLGYCWPCVLAPMLSHSGGDVVQRVMTAVEAVLVEFPDLPITWQLFGTAQLPDLLGQLGFQRETAVVRH